MERLISSGFALVIMGIGCQMLYEFFNLLRKSPERRERDLVFFVVWPFTSPLTGIAAISLGAYVLFRDIGGWHTTPILFELAVLLATITVFVAVVVVLRALRTNGGEAKNYRRAEKIFEMGVLVLVVGGLLYLALHYS